MKKGFTLLEVLVAAGILFIVGSATVGLSNSIIQGTAQTSDETVANRLASEGLELATKKRDDTVKLASGDEPWFAPAVSSAEYGWYQVGSTGELSRISLALDPPLTTSTVPSNSALPVGIKQQVGNQDYYRLICIEAVAATPNSDTELVNCNLDETDSIISDGNRSGPSTTSCDTADYYCNMVNVSTSRNRTGGVAIPPGNAVKIRSVVVWQDKEQYRTSQISTLLTNWKSTLDVQ